MFSAASLTIVGISYHHPADIISLQEGREEKGARREEEGGKGREEEGNSRRITVCSCNEVRH